mgnify:CR=1 FL=1
MPVVQKKSEKKKRIRKCCSHVSTKVRSTRHKGKTRERKDEGSALIAATFVMLAFIISDIPNFSTWTNIANDNLSLRHLSCIFFLQWIAEN